MNHPLSRTRCLTLALAALTAFVAAPSPAAAAVPASASAPLTVGQKFTVPTSVRAVYNFNPGWKFVWGDQSGADQVAYNDSSWESVSLPHTWNDIDTYRKFIRHGSGDTGENRLGIGWYRKHFKLPASADGQKVFLQFEGMRQAGRFYLNGQAIGKFENGITAFGFDITKYVKFGGQDNVLAVKADNSTTYKEEATGTGFQWNAKDFNPNFGGLNRDAWLIVTGPVYQTLPIYENLKNTGVYIYGQNYDIKGKKADIHVESEVKNESGDYASITLSSVVVDADGIVRAKLDGGTTDLVSGQSELITAQGPLDNAHFWDVKDPYLYDVYSILTVNGKVADVVKTQTGFRKVEYKGGVGTGGVWLNDRFVWLTGYAQRSANDWPGLGGAYPDWMHDFSAALLRASNGNYVRWMHVSPQRADVTACDKYGIAIVCPAGDKEALVRGRQWEQRVEVMRDSMIFFRNNPSVLFWEAGNTIVTPEQMNEMVALRKELDPNGGRVMGSRDNDSADLNMALTPMSEFFGVMIGQDARTDSAAQQAGIFRGYNNERRDKAPIIETEDFRDEAARRFWDDFSPPHFGFKPKNEGVRDTGDTYHWNSETFTLAGANRYTDYVLNRIDNKDPAHSKWSGYASIYWSDSDADGRQDASEMLRVSGKVDGVRIPKQMFYMSRVMQNDKPDLHIIGHWNYPAGTKKPMYVAATQCDQVEFFVNGQSKGVQKTACNPVDPYTGRRMGYTGFVYEFPDITFEPGTIKAVASKDGKVVAQEEIKTAGAPAAIKLTLHTGPKGLQADGGDVALVDFEVVDAQGNRCPTDEARVDFAVDGPVIWRGGLNSGILDSTNNLYLNTEAGINRVAMRSTMTPGTITLTAKRDGLTPATLKIESKPVAMKDGLATDAPQGFPGLSAPIANLVR